MKNDKSDAAIIEAVKAALKVVNDEEINEESDNTESIEAQADTAAEAPAQTASDVAEQGEASEPGGAAVRSEAGTTEARSAEGPAEDGSDEKAFIAAFNHEAQPMKDADPAKSEADDVVNPEKEAPETQAAQTEAEQPGIVKEENIPEDNPVPGAPQAPTKEELMNAMLDKLMADAPQGQTPPRPEGQVQPAPEGAPDNMERSGISQEQDNKPKRDMTAEWAELANAHPELVGNKLPNDIYKAIITSDKTPLQVYDSMMLTRMQERLDTLEKENAALKDAQSRVMRAPVTGVIAGGATRIEPDDPFVRGFNRYV